MPRILVVDDDKDMCNLLTRFLLRHNFDVQSAGSGQAALERLDKYRPDLVLCDYRLDDMRGIDLLVRMKEALPGVAVIIITGYSDVKEAVEAMKSGAYDYVTKPLLPDEILVTISNALSAKQAGPGSPNDRTETGRPSQRTGDRSKNKYIWGDSRESAEIMKQIELVAPTNFSVIIYGESGSGKEVIAQQIHEKSKRANQPFVAIDCGALSRELAGSELFGHEKGSFTGATSQKTGSLEVANGGTVFLDEIGNLSYEIQVSLLRVVQERKIRRIGSLRDINIDVRIIIASNERLWDAARAGKFREDLYHRFNEFSIDVPPLRDRKSDIMLFARHFLHITNEELQKKIIGFTPEAESILKAYVWFGNLRELKNVIKRATLLTDTDLIDSRSLPFEITNFSKLNFDSPVTPEGSIAFSGTGQDRAATMPGNKLKNANIEAEYEVILEALKKADFNKSRAAELLQIDRKTLYNKMKQYKDLRNGEF